MKTPPKIINATIDARSLSVELDSGIQLVMPLDHVPTLLLATEQERQKMQIYPHSLTWEDLDCDLSVEGLLQGARELPCLAQKAWNRFIERTYHQAA